MIGRVHSLTQSISIDNRIRSILTERNIDYLEFDPITDDIKKLALLVRQEFGV
jgi:hypothetical protein